MKLSELFPGNTAVVTGIVGGSSADLSLTRRLRDLGLTDGTQGSCVLVSPVGDPSASRFRGAVVAMRKKDADAVEVEYAAQ